MHHDIPVPLPPAQAARHAADLLRMLHPHHTGHPPRAHGQISPLTVRLKDDGSLKLLMPQPTPPPEAIPYIAPEDRKRGRPSRAGDRFSIGAWLAYLITAKHPPDCRPQDLAAAGPLAPVITRLMAPDPADRFPSLEATYHAMAALFRAPPARASARAPEGTPCPGCRSPMEAVPFPLDTANASRDATPSNVEVDLCRTCKGLWFDTGELQRLLESAGSAEPAPASTPTKPGSRLCPRCHQPMQVSAWSQRHPIEVDRCPAHGFYLDDKEFVQLRAARRAPPKPSFQAHAAAVTSRASAATSGAVAPELQQRLDQIRADVERIAPRRTRRLQDDWRWDDDNDLVDDLIDLFD